MSIMKKLLFTAAISFISSVAFGQVSTDPIEFTPDQEIKIIVDLNATSNDWGIVEIAAGGEDMYIWTWSPFEWGANDSLANGLGSQAWKNSNPALKMTKEGEGIYSYTMTPTEFYAVDAATVYDKDIEFLVKPLDGGGFGDDDRKTEDLRLPVDPAITVRDPGYAFPVNPSADDVIQINYDYARENFSDGRMLKLQPNDPSCTTEMLNEDEVWMFAEATTTDSVKHVISNFFTVTQNPDLLMDYAGDGTYVRYIVPSEFFADVVPPGSEIMSIRFVPMTDYFLINPAGTDPSCGINENRSAKDIVIDLSCP